MLEYKLTQMTSNEKKLLKEISRMEVELKSLKPENGQFDVCKLNFIFISLNKNQKEECHLIIYKVKQQSNRY